uniref:IgGFc_binding domain-containing protein n=1 Tax=Rhabditophanes sp. KR3021 TaxID=114890 RepID=A0AC35U976_9BILA
MLYLLYLLSLFGFFANATDTDGTQFVTSFLNYDLDSEKKYELSISFLLVEKNVDFINISYYSLTTKTVEHYNDFKINQGEDNKVFFDYNKLIAPTSNATKNIEMICDPRIFIQSNYPMKVIASLYDTKSGKTDMYIVPSIKFAGTDYKIKLPTPDYDGYQMFNIFTTPGIETEVSIDIHFFGGNKSHNTRYLKGDIGSDQIQVILPKEYGLARVIIKAYNPIIVVAAISKYDILEGAVSNKESFDYMAYVPQPLSQWPCTIKNEATKYFTKRISQRFTHKLSLHSSNLVCKKLPNPFRSMFFNEESPFTELKIKCEEKHSSDIGNKYISSSNKDLTFTGIGQDFKMSRTGFFTTEKNPQDITLHHSKVGAFINYIPDASEYIVGKTQFVMNGNGYIEIYGLDKFNLTNFKLNGENLNLDDVQDLELDLNLCKICYGYVINVNKNGYNTMESIDPYIAYVIGKRNNKDYGYLSGFNHSSYLKENYKRMPYKKIVFNIRDQSNLFYVKSNLTRPIETEQINGDSKSNETIIFPNSVLPFVGNSTLPQNMTITARRRHFFVSATDYIVKLKDMIILRVTDIKIFCRIQNMIYTNKDCKGATPTQNNEMNEKINML